MGSKFNLVNAPATLAGEAERMLLATMWCHDKHQHGLGGYYITKNDMERLRRILGDATDLALRGAGFKPDPRPRHKGWWTGSRSPVGDESMIRIRLNWGLFRTLEAAYGDSARRFRAA